MIWFINFLSSDPQNYTESREGMMVHAHGPSLDGGVVVCACDRSLGCRVVVLACDPSFDSGDWRQVDPCSSLVPWPNGIDDIKVQ